jgi:outer membrane protein assembly factor BamB
VSFNLLAALLIPAALYAQHDFFYAGEQKQQKMFILRHGEVVWSYFDPQGRGEISDAMLLSNGDVLFAHQYGVTLINREKKVLWHYAAPVGTEIHTAQVIGTGYVVFVQNGDPALVRVMRISSGEIEREFPLPTGNPKSVHGQFRHARLTDAGTLLVAHMDMKKVAEYDARGKEVWSYAIDSPWSAVRLASGNTLIATNRKLVREVDRAGTTGWELTADDLPRHRIDGFQIATRLANGNTMVNNWFNTWSAAVDYADPPLQALEVTPDKKVVWVLRSWKEPDLGPATTVQLLDQPTPDKSHFGDFR